MSRSTVCGEMNEVEIKWEEEARICVGIEGGTAVISANRKGLQSLANHLKELSKEKPGSHIHYDEYNSLEDGSSELIVELIK